MLFDLNENRITHIPHRQEYNQWRSNILDSDYNLAVAAIEEYIEGKDVFTSSFIPGHDWTGTPYEPLFHACGQSITQSGFFFGLIIWNLIMENDEEWIFKPSEKDDGDPLGMMYWRKNRPQQ